MKVDPSSTDDISYKQFRSDLIELINDNPLLFDRIEKDLLIEKWKLNDINDDIDIPLSPRETCERVHMLFMDYEIGAYESSVHRKVIKQFKLIGNSCDYSGMLRMNGIRV